MVAVTKVSILGADTIHVGYGILDHIVSETLEHIKSSTYVIISDTNIARFQHVENLEAKLSSAIAASGNSARVLKYLIHPGEGSKNRQTKATVEDWMLAQGCTRDTVILAVGGGVIGDMFGYVAASFMRGIRFVQIPTSLLAMVDSSIGGKTGIDAPSGKNLIGAFWQPQRIFIDLVFLETLPEREFINGMAEVIKTAAIWDATEFDRLESYNKIFFDTIRNRDATGRVDLAPIREIIHNIVLGSVRVKAQVVTADEREGGLRNILNFGHTIGHAYEAMYMPNVLHGEAVSIGMVLEAELSRYLGTLSATAVARLTKCLAAYHLPISPEDKLVRKRTHNMECRVEDLLRIMNVDKKNDGAKKKVVLLSEIGKTYEKKATVVVDKDIRTVIANSLRVGYFEGHSPAKIEVTPPGSKSISNRALVLAALGKGPCKIKNLLHSDDTEHMVNAVKLLQGAQIDLEEGGDVLVLNGNGGNLVAPAEELYLGNAGTASRFLTTVATLVQPSSASSHVVLTGNARMKERPIGPLVDALRSNGSDVEYLGNKGSLPLKIAAGKGLEGGRIELAATISSQYVSSILMCAPYAKSPVTLALVGGKPISQLYIDMTIAMMASFGIQVEKSTTEAYTYHVPQGVYTNPPEYVVESDASSATYPLAFAAMTGTECTVPNIGSSSLQGDARFAVDVLRPMGCAVEQTATSTTVRGPALGSLKPLPLIDMEPMTDAFLTASVVAAIARGSSSNTTKITGIANQRVKECNRIDAMIHELAKFGVQCREHADGLEIDGINVRNLKVPENGVHTYDDHRVAMSFSLLASVIDKDVVITDRRTVGKTWPGWWDTLAGSFKVPLDGLSPKKETAAKSNGRNSIFVIGMRGAGKTTLSKWVASSLGFHFEDLDNYMEAKLSRTIPEIVKEDGWEGFRKAELDILKLFMTEHTQGVVAACGGGIVETPEARKILADYAAKGNIVLHVHRDISSIIRYLQIDKERPAYVDDIEAVWKRREHWFAECSNFMYFSPDFEGVQETVKVRKSLDTFTKVITGVTPVEVPRSRSYFLSLTYEDLSTVDNWDLILEGSTAIELRVDLLKQHGQVGPIPTPEYVASQVALVRKNTLLPIIYTVRTKAQGGKFPDGAEAEVERLLRLALKLGIEFVDVELSLPADLVDSIVRDKGASKIIASNHDFSGTLKWTDAAWKQLYQRAEAVGDVVKFVGMATSLEDNFALEQFRASHSGDSKLPLIAINMGAKGQLSRVLNPVLTPVTHSAVPVIAAPGQLSVKQIHEILASIGGLETQEFLIAGHPVTYSPSPSMHNTGFKTIGLPHQYGRFDTESAEEAVAHFKSLGSRFGGGSVTIPLKVDFVPLMDELSEDVKAIGALNTVIPLGNGKLRGDNTDWLGIVGAFKEAGADASSVSGGLNALIVGAGGTSRSAVYALHKLGYNKIFILNRTPAKAQAVADAFDKSFNVHVVHGKADAEAIAARGEVPTVTMSCVPADKPIDGAVLECIDILLGTKLPGNINTPRVLLDAAYRPSVTPLMTLAESLGWTVVGGREMLYHQGLQQFKLWTGLVAPASVASAI